MASSQVEISPSSPFGCVLRDRNQHSGYRTRDSNTFKKNFNDLVQNQLSSCRNASSDSLANENSHTCIDAADLWVHHPQTTIENNHHTTEPAHTRISDRSNSNQNSPQKIDYTDLWVHNPQRNNDENNQKKSNSGGKCDRARDAVLAVERKSENSVYSGPHVNPPRERSQDGAHSLPVSRVRSPESSRPVSSSERRRRSLEDASSGLDSTSLMGKSQSGTVSTSQTESSVRVPWVHNPQRNNDENNQKKSNSGGKCDRARDAVLAVERKIENSVSSGPHANPPRGRSQDGAHSLPVSRVRSPESSGPVSSYERRRSLEGASSGLASTSLKGKSQSGTVSTSQTESSVKVPNLGAVSSLVQKWRNFEGKRSSAACNSKCNPCLVWADNASFVEPAARSSDSCDESIDIGPGTPRITEDSNGDCESVRTGFSASPGRDSDATEKERIRVSDIIRKLSSNNEEHNDREHVACHESLPRVRTTADQSEQRPFSPVVPCSPRIRGRQAFCDFQMQMERERHKDLEGLAGYKAVSKFSHRGRIQAMLRVRFLHRGAEVKDGRPPNCTSSNSNGLKQSAIMHLRKIFSLGAKHCVPDLTSSQGDVVDCSSEIEKFSTSCRQRKENPENKLSEPINPPIIDSDTSAEVEGSLRSNSVERDNNHESNNMVEQNGVQGQRSERIENHHLELAQLANPPTTVSKGSADATSSFRLMAVQIGSKHLKSNSENLYQEASSSSDKIQQWSSSDSCNHRKPELPLIRTSFQGIEGNIYTEFLDANNQQPEENGNESINETSETQSDREEEKDYNDDLGCSWVSDVFDQMSGVEGPLSDYQQEIEIDRDWIHDVSRPRSTWEDLRQARYQEMLDPFVENDEIRCLLERKSVSSFLSSGMRGKIDRLMMSRSQQISRTDQLEGESEREIVKEEKDKEREGGEGRAYEQNNEEVEVAVEEEEEEEDSVDYSDDYEDQEHEIQSGHHNVPKSYVNQTTSWVHIRGDNYCNQTASPYIEQSPLSNISTLVSRQSVNHHSIEMELICELKGNVKQLHQEISELRRSIKSCIDMQVELQQSIKQDIKAALCPSGKQKRRERRDSRRGRCCICYEVPIDSLLYRCGHMCTCFNCAHELQCSSGKCPVCRAPIIDVVRAYAHS